MLGGPTPDARRETTQELFERDDVVSEYADFDFLLPAERSILDELSPSLGSWRVLDLGVGAGRTTPHLADRARSYAGLDVSEAMIRACRDRFGGRHGAAFVVGDARRLPFREGAFDLVLFSFNGLDTVGDRADRLSALAEVHRVCAPGGVFWFSSQRLAFVRAKMSYLEAIRALARGGPRQLVRRPKVALSALRRVRHRRSMDPHARALRGAGSVIELRRRHELSGEGFETPDESIAIRRYSIDRQEQVAELHGAGFDTVRVFASTGTELTTPGEPRVRGWPMPYLYYLCRKGG